MPRIIVTADGPTGNVMLSERINATDLESGQFRAQLVERLAWAIGDACAQPSRTTRIGPVRSRRGAEEPRAVSRGAHRSRGAPSPSSGSAV